MTKPAPKGENDESSRMWASASFVGVLIVVGLPLWWKTTEVYRVSLPYDKIAALDPLSHVVTTELEVLANDDATAAELAGLIEKAFQDNDVIKVKVKWSALPEPLRRAVHAAADEAQAARAAAARAPGPGRLLLVQRRLPAHRVWLAGDRVMLFKDADAAQTVVAALREWVLQTSVLAGARAAAADAARRRRAPPAPAYRVRVLVPHDYHLEDDIQDYIGSFLDELSELHNFTLQSQSLHNLDFDFQAKEMQSGPGGLGRHWAAPRARLPRLLGELEQRAGGGEPRRPALTLALPPPACARLPLYIYEASETPNLAPIQAFLSPQWGGVVLSNPSEEECRTGEWKPPTRLIMGAFISHLRTLLGIVEPEPIEGAFLDPLRSVSPRRWELDTLLRIRTLEQLTAAERTLRSLAQLLGEISNIVINDEVGASIATAVESARAAGAALRAGDAAAAHRAARAAAGAAEAAFTDPSLLALLYFPDDQKYAIYIPLFLPIMFPVVLSLKNLALWARGKPTHQKVD